VCVVSIIVPAYNVEKYIEKTLKSIINQSFKDFEVIIVNDGSTDNIEKVVKDTLKNVDFSWKLINQKNQGVSAARNKGFLESKGEYVCFLDGDDYYHSAFLEKSYKKIKEGNFDIVYCGFDIVDRNGVIISTYNSRNFEYLEKPTIGREALKLYINGYIGLFTASCIYNRKMLVEKNIKHTRGCIHGEDTEFILKALFHSKFITNVFESLVYYVQREGSATKSVSLKIFHRVVAMKRTKKYLEKNGADIEILDLMQSKRIPATYLGCFVHLARGDNNYKKFLLNASKNKKLKVLLVNYKANNWKAKIVAQAYLYFPVFFYFYYNKLKKQ
jgi:glycosyltransferase involved in cell wall biosynthesis